MGHKDVAALLLDRGAKVDAVSDVRRWSLIVG